MVLDVSSSRKSDAFGIAHSTSSEAHISPIETRQGQENADRLIIDDCAQCTAALGRSIFNASRVISSQVGRFPGNEIFVSTGVIPGVIRSGDTTEYSGVISGRYIRADSGVLIYPIFDERNYYRFALA